MKLKSNSLPCRLLLFSLLFLVVTLILLQPTVCQAAETAKVIPVEEWTGIPEWSPDGRFVAVNWPAPALVGADGNLSRVKGASTKRSGKVLTAGSSGLSGRDKRPVGTVDNLRRKRTLILKSPSYELLPIALPEIENLCWSPDGTMVAGEEFNVGGQIFSIVTGKLLLAFDDYHDRSQFAWSPDSKLIAESHRHGVDVWNVARKEKVFSFPSLRAGKYTSLAWSPDGTKVAAAVARSNRAMQRKTLLRICSNSGQELLSLYDKLGINSIGWSNDKNVFAYSDNALHILDGSSFKELRVLRPKGAEGTERVYFVWAPNGKYLAYSTEDATLHVLDVSKMEEISTMQSDKTGRFYFEWSPDSRYLLLQGFDRFAVCRASDGCCLGSGGSDHFAAVAWTPDGKALVRRNISAGSVILLPVDLQEGKIAFNKAIAGNPWLDQKVPCNLDDCFAELDKALNASEIEELQNIPEDKLRRYADGMSLNIKLQDILALRHTNPLTTCFRKIGISDISNMSSFIIMSFGRRLHGLPLGFEELVAAYRQEEENRKYIIFENRILPDELLNCECSLKGEKAVTIRQLPGEIRVVTFVEDSGFLSNFVVDKGYLSSRQMGAFLSVRQRYPEKQVSFVIVMLSERAIGKGGGSWRVKSGCIAARDEIEKKCKASIYFATGTSKIFGSLKEFTHGQVWTANSFGGLPQTLIISDKNIVTTRINGPVSEDDTFPIEDAIDELLKPGRK